MTLYALKRVTEFGKAMRAAAAAKLPINADLVVHPSADFDTWRPGVDGRLHPRYDHTDCPRCGYRYDRVYEHVCPDETNR